MKAIITHDVDHLRVSEHSGDLVIPKFLLRTSLGLLHGKVSPREFHLRLVALGRNKWHNLEPLMAFDRTHGIPATFFVAVSNGRGLSYSLADAEHWIARIREQGFDVGVHGIAYDEVDAIERERRVFEKISGLDSFGIRIHGLRTSADTLQLLSRAGYLFDSSLSEITGPRRVGEMYEFPLHLMDSFLVRGKKKYTYVSFEDAREATKALIAEAECLGLPYLTVLFHDRYFCDSFATGRDWYSWLVEYLAGCGIEPISVRAAIRELGRSTVHRRPISNTGLSSSSPDLDRG
jgi:hypothetical protein